MHGVVNNRSFLCCWGLAFVYGFILAVDAPAILFQSTDDPFFNTSAPEGALAGSGWQYQGQWDVFQGTVIAPQYFITAKHIGGVVGNAFVFRGVSYVTTERLRDPDTDLTIWKIEGTFPDFASLHSGTNEVGRSLVVMGRGTRRGAEIRVDDVLKGWEWGIQDHVQRWGENVVTEVSDYGMGMGSFLCASFDHGAGATEASLSSGDSGGGVFMLEDGAWKLAGINYGVDSPYKRSPEDTTRIFGCLFDQSGLYVESGTNWIVIPDALPGCFYASRISTRLEWIYSVIRPQSPAQAALTCLGKADGELSLEINAPYATAWMLQSSTNLIHWTTLPGQPFIIHSNGPSRITASFDTSPAVFYRLLAVP